MYVCMYVCMYVYIYIYTYTYIYRERERGVYVCVHYTHMYICVCVCVHHPAWWVVSRTPTSPDPGLTGPPGANVRCGSPRRTAGAGAWKPECPTGTLWGASLRRGTKTPEVLGGAGQRRSFGKTPRGPLLKVPFGGWLELKPSATWGSPRG